MSITRWSVRSLHFTSNARLTQNGAKVSDSTYTVLLTDDVILSDASGGNRTLTLPTPVSADGKEFCIRRIDASANNVTLKTTAKSIDGYFGFVLDPNETIIVFSDGSDWRIKTPRVVYNNGSPVTIDDYVVTF